MAEQADGRVEIDTELDTSGFEKGSDKLQESMKSLVDSMEKLSSTATKLFERDWQNIKPETITPEIAQFAFTQKIMT